MPPGECSRPAASGPRAARAVSRWDAAARWPRNGEDDIELAGVFVVAVVETRAPSM